jgi:hypothetical protein
MSTLTEIHIIAHSQLKYSPVSMQIYPQMASLANAFAVCIASVDHYMCDLGTIG